MQGLNLASFARSLPMEPIGWNWIINPGFLYNARGATSKAQAAGVYGYDRWKGGTVTGTLTQVVEALPAGDYAVRYTVGGVTEKEEFTHAGGNRDISVPNTVTWVEVTDVKVERADIRPPPFEIMLCGRYCQTVMMTSQFYAAIAGQTLDLPVLWPWMRDVPTITVLGAGALTNMTSAAITPETPGSGFLRMVATGPTANAIVAQKRFLLTAEL